MGLEPTTFTLATWAGRVLKRATTKSYGARRFALHYSFRYRDKLRYPESLLSLVDLSRRRPKPPTNSTLCSPARPLPSGDADEKPGAAASAARQRFRGRESRKNLRPIEARSRSAGGGVDSRTRWPHPRGTWCQPGQQRRAAPRSIRGPREPAAGKLTRPCKGGGNLSRMVV